MKIYYTLVLLIILAFLALAKDEQESNKGSERKSKQLWPVIHTRLPLIHHHTRAHVVQPPMTAYDIGPMAPEPMVKKKDEVTKPEPEVSSLDSRHANTMQDLDFAEDSTPEEEKAIVESVNKLIGAVGRQALNGVDIFAEDPLGNSDGVLPGRPTSTVNRPNPAPIESSSQRLPASIGSGSRNQDCCLFVFFDGSAYYFDEYLRLLTGPYRLMYGTVNGHPHYVARGCKEPDHYGSNCSYIWNSGYGWVIGIGSYIGQTKGVVYTRSSARCPTDTGARWRYLNKDLEWKDNGNIYVTCAS